MMASRPQNNKGNNRNRHRNRHQQKNTQKHKRSSKPVPQGLFSTFIEKLSHDGRGIARVDGKTTFIEGALTGEQVEYRYIQCHSRYDEAIVSRIETPAPERVSPPCMHADVCGGCSLQHLSPEAQVSLKQSVLLEQLDHFGDLKPDKIADPIVGESCGYRRKARFAVNHGSKSNSIVGFREKNSSRVVPITLCTVLSDRLGHLIPELQTLISELKNAQAISHIDLAQGDKETALTFRHPKALCAEDIQSLLIYCQQNHYHLYLQPGASDSSHKVWPQDASERLSYWLPMSNASTVEHLPIEIRFHPNDFIQVNAVNNRLLVSQAIDYLQLNQDDRVLDLFCGIGNFTLPMAQVAGKVVGVEGSDLMITRGQENARYNKLSNIEFYGADLTKSMDKQPWASQGFTKILIDPPRAGALEVVQNIARFSPEKIVYVSCNPATLARDAGELERLGYQMVCVGVVDMFPHTTHVESIALFQPR